MIVYHGSNVAVEKPRILPNQRRLDFGEGFYLTSDKNQAIKWSKYKAKRFGGRPTVTSYTINKIELAKLATKGFSSPNIEWLDLIATHRLGKDSDLKVDAIIGPVADDATMDVLQSYFSGTMKAEHAIEQLLPFKLKDQYALKTEDALKTLTLKGVEYFD